MGGGSPRPGPLPGAGESAPVGEYPRTGSQTRSGPGPARGDRGPAL